jgi:hypothetical protein
VSPVEDRIKQGFRTIATALSFVDALGVLAAPRVAAKVEKWPTRAQLQEMLDVYLQFVDRCKGSTMLANQETVQTEPHALKLRELFSTWTPSANVPPEIMLTSRTLIETSGLGAPDEGWDQWEGPPDEPPPTPEEVEQRLKMQTSVYPLMNKLTILVVPGFAILTAEWPTSDQLQQLIDKYLELLSALKERESPSLEDQRLIAAEPHARNLRDLFSIWIPSVDVPSEIKHAARALLDTAGFGPPKEGWDEAGRAPDRGPQRLP